VKNLAKMLPFFLFLMAGPLLAETAPNLDLDQLLAGNRALVKETIQLAGKEGAVFWPLYEDYEKNRIYIFNRYSVLLKKYMQERENLSDSKAEEMMSEIREIQAEDLESRRLYFKKLSQKLPYRRVFQYFIFEERIEAGYQAFIAEELPEVK